MSYFRLRAVKIQARTLGNRLHTIGLWMSALGQYDLH